MILCQRGDKVYIPTSIWRSNNFSGDFAPGPQTRGIGMEKREGWEARRSEGKDEERREGRRAGNGKRGEGTARPRSEILGYATDDILGLMMTVD